MAVRTCVLSQGQTVNGSTIVVYTCPMGRTAILKDLRVTPISGGNTQCIFSVRSGADGVYLMVGALSAGTYGDNDLWVVLEPGHDIVAFTTGAACNYRLSGTELDGVAP